MILEKVFPNHFINILTFSPSSDNISFTILIVSE